MYKIIHDDIKIYPCYLQSGSEYILLISETDQGLPAD